jgi:hypothetical protein
MQIPRSGLGSLPRAGRTSCHPNELNKLVTTSMAMDLLVCWCCGLGAVTIEYQGETLSEVIRAMRS